MPRNILFKNSKQERYRTDKTHSVGVFIIYKYWIYSY